MKWKQSPSGSLNHCLHLFRSWREASTGARIQVCWLLEGGSVGAGRLFLFWLCEYVFKPLCFVLLKIFNIFILCGVELISNTVLISGVRQNDTVVHVCVLFQVLFPFRMLHNLCATKSCFGILASPFHLDCWPVYAASPTTGRGTWVRTHSTGFR